MSDDVTTKAAEVVRQVMLDWIGDEPDQDAVAYYDQDTTGVAQALHDAGLLATPDVVAAAERAGAVRALHEAADDLDRRANEPWRVVLADKYEGFHAGERAAMQCEVSALRARAADRVEGGAPCPTCTGQTRETTGMVCQTCGTDYAEGGAR